MSPCNVEELEAHALGQLSSAGSASVLSHVAGCRACGRELSFLTAERAAFAARARADVAPLSALRRGVEARLWPQPAFRVPFFARWFTPVLSAAVLAVAVLVALPHQGLGPARSCGPGLAPAICVDEVASLETRYGACLIATPKTNPGACW